MAGEFVFPQKILHDFSVIRNCLLRGSFELLISGRMSTRLYRSKVSFFGISRPIWPDGVYDLLKRSIFKSPILLFYSMLAVEKSLRYLKLLSSLRNVYDLVLMHLPMHIYHRLSVHYCGVYCLWNKFFSIFSAIFFYVTSVIAGPWLHVWLTYWLHPQHRVHFNRNHIFTRMYIPW